MKILIDINHPAHVHYFKNLIKIMKKKGHSFVIVSRNKEIEHYLLKKEKIQYIGRGKGSGKVLGKISYFFSAIFFLMKIIRRHKPDILVSFGTPYPAVAGWLLRMPHISFDDTEHAKMHHLLTVPFSKTVVTPTCYIKDIGKKQIRFDGYMELAYLHPKYFKPDESILSLLGVNKREKYVIIRFVSWNAAHDIGQSGLTLEKKIKLVNILSKHVKVFISSEGVLPDELKDFRIKIPPERIHDALAFASLFIGEGATMASECAVLGTPAIYVNSLEVGYCTEQQNKYGMVYGFRDSNGVIEKALELIKLPELSIYYNEKRQKIIHDKIEVTSFMVWFIENYPKSKSILKNNPDYQYNFK